MPPPNHRTRRQGLRSSNTMLLFTCARDASYADVKKYGLRPSGMGHRLLRSYDAAVRQCAGRLLVVELSRSELDKCQIHDHLVIAPAVPLQSFCNLNPYAQVEPVTAAGGVLVRRRRKELQVLMIHRRDTWDLPKGKRDGAESISACAEREVCEEIGIDSVELICPLDITLHGYRERDRYLLKKTHWFLMRTTAKRFKPQAAEDIDKVEWVEWKDARERAGYATLRDLLKRSRPVAKQEV